MWERSGMVHLHWNCNNYNGDSNTRQERESRESTKHPAARGWELAISTNPELVCRHGWRQWRTTAGPFSSFLGSVNTAEGDTGGDPVMVITSIIQQ